MVYVDDTGRVHINLSCATEQCVWHNDALSIAFRSKCLWFSIIQLRHTVRFWTQFWESLVGKHVNFRSAVRYVLRQSGETIVFLHYPFVDCPWSVAWTGFHLCVLARYPCMVLRGLPLISACPMLWICRSEASANYWYRRFEGESQYSNPDYRCGCSSRVSGVEALAVIQRQNSISSQGAPFGFQQRNTRRGKDGRVTGEIAGRVP